MNDANGRHFELAESVWLTVRFSNHLYCVKFIIGRLLAVEVIIGTEFINQHVLAISYTQQRIIFRNGEAPIYRQMYTRGDEGEDPFVIKN